MAGYKSARNKWTNWYCRQQTDLPCVPLNEILNYLLTLFEKSLQYRTINSHCSAISAYHNYVNAESVLEATKTLLYICLSFGLFEKKNA